MEIPRPAPVVQLQLVGVTYAARCLGISDECLRKRISKGISALRPVGQLSDPTRWIFRKVDVSKAVAAQRRYDQSE